MINIENEGLFGDLSAWCYATEEQGYKTLHAHFLLWVNNWSVMLEKLRNPSENPNIELILRKHASTIMRTSLHFLDSLTCQCGIPIQDATKCTHQDLRNLRTREGITSLGGKSILRCNGCQQSFSGNDIITIAVDKEFTRL